MKCSGRPIPMRSAGKWAIAGLGLFFGVVGCSIAAGAGIGAAMVGTAAVTRGCYDSVDVEVMDAVTGSRACSSEVSAQEAGGSTTRFSSCFHAELPTGRWIVTARQPGYQPASSEVVVTNVGGCEPAVQSVALTLRPEGAPPAAAIALRPRPPGEAPINPGTFAAPASMGAAAGLPGEGVVPPSTPNAPTSPASAQPATTSGAAGAPAGAVGTAAFPVGDTGGVAGGTAGAAGALALPSGAGGSGQR